MHSGAENTSIILSKQKDKIFELQTKIKQGKILLEQIFEDPDVNLHIKKGQKEKKIL